MPSIASSQQQQQQEDKVLDINNNNTNNNHNFDDPPPAAATTTTKVFTSENHLAAATALPNQVECDLENIIIVEGQQNNQNNNNQSLLSQPVTPQLAGEKLNIQRNLLSINNTPQNNNIAERTTTTTSHENASNASTTNYYNGSVTVFEKIEEDQKIAQHFQAAVDANHRKLNARKQAKPIFGLQMPEDFSHSNNNKNDLQTMNTTVDSQQQDLDSNWTAGDSSTGTNKNRNNYLKNILENNGGNSQSIALMSDDDEGASCKHSQPLHASENNKAHRINSNDEGDEENRLQAQQRKKSDDENKLFGQDGNNNNNNNDDFTNAAVELAPSTKNNNNNNNNDNNNENNITDEDLAYKDFKNLNPSLRRRYLRRGATLTMNRFELSLNYFEAEGVVRSTLFRIYDHWGYDVVISALVIANIVLVLLSNPTIVNNNNFVTYEHVFAFNLALQAIYTIELAGKVVTLGLVMHPYAFLRNWDDLLDLVVVICGYATLAFGHDGATIAASNTAVTLRNMKIIRVHRVVKLMMHFQVVRAIFMTLQSSVRGMRDIVFLLLFIVLGMSVLGLQLFIGNFQHRCYFKVYPTNATYPNVSQLVAMGVEPMFMLNPQHPHQCSTDVGYGHQCSGGSVCTTNRGVYELHFVNFDFIGDAFFVTLKLISVDNWNVDVERMQFSTGLWYAFYACIIVVFGTFLTMNLIIGVLSAQYELAIMLLREEMEEKEAEEESERLLKEAQRQKTIDSTGALTIFNESVKNNNHDLPNHQHQDEANNNNNSSLRQNLQFQGSYADFDGDIDSLSTKDACFVKVQRFRRWFDVKVMSSDPVTLLSILVTLLNIGVLASMYHGISVETIITLDYINFACGMYFVLEVTIFIFARGLRYFEDAINVVDSILALLAIIEAVVVGLSANGTVFAAFRGIRMFRVLRLGTRIKALRKIFKTVGVAAKSAAALFAVMAIYLVGFAIFAVFLFEDAMPPGFRPNFTSMRDSLLTLFMLLTSENVYATIAAAMEGSNGFAGPFLVFYFWTGCYIIKNFFVVILINSFSEAAQLDRLITDKEAVGIVVDDEGNEVIAKGNQDPDLDDDLQSAARLAGQESGNWEFMENYKMDQQKEHGAQLENDKKKLNMSSSLQKEQMRNHSLGNLVRRKSQHDVSHDTKDNDGKKSHNDSGLEIISGRKEEDDGNHERIARTASGQFVRRKSTQLLKRRNSLANVLAELNDDDDDGKHKKPSSRPASAGSGLHKSGNNSRIQRKISFVAAASSDDEDEEIKSVNETKKREVLNAVDNNNNNSSAKYSSSRKKSNSPSVNHEEASGMGSRKPSSGSIRVENIGDDDIHDDSDQDHNQDQKQHLHSYVASPLLPRATPHNDGGNEVVSEKTVSHDKKQQQQQQQQQQPQKLQPVSPHFASKVPAHVSSHFAGDSGKNDSEIPSGAFGFDGSTNNNNNNNQNAFSTQVAAEGLNGTLKSQDSALIPGLINMNDEDKKYNRRKRRNSSPIFGRHDELAETLKIRQQTEYTFLERLAAFLGVEDYQTKHLKLQGESFWIFPPESAFRQNVCKICVHPIFELVVVFFVLESCVAVSFDNNRAKRFAPGLGGFLTVSNIVVSVLFAIEALLKMIAFGVATHEGSYLRVPFNVFDFFIVLISLFSIFFPISSLIALRGFRLAAKWKAMRVVLESLARALPGILHVITLMTILLFSFAVVGVHLFVGQFVSCTDESILTRENCTGKFNYTLYDVKFPNNGSTYISEVVERERMWEFQFYNFNDVANGMLSMLVVFFSDGWSTVFYFAMDATNYDTAMIRDGVRGDAIAFFVVTLVIGNFFTNNLFVGSLMNSFKQQQDYANGLTDLEGRALLTEEQQEWVKSYRFVAATALPQRPPPPENFFRRFCCWIYFQTSDMVKPRQVTELFFSFCIVTTIAFMASEFEGEPNYWPGVLFIADLVLNIIFTVEVVIAFVALRPVCFVVDSWNIFNVFLVAASFVSQFLGGPGMSAIRVTRVARLLRLIPRAKGLHRMYSTLVYSLPELLNIFMLLLLILYMFGVVATQLFENLDQRVNFFAHNAAADMITEMYNFEHAGVSMFALFQMSTTAGWADVVEACANMKPENSPCSHELGTCGTPLALPFFVVFMLCVNSILLNVFTFVIVDQYLQVKQLQNVRIEWLLLQLEVFRENWAQLDVDRSRFLRYEAAALCYKILLLQENKMLRKFREDIDEPVIVLRGESSEVLVREVLAFHAIPTTAELELEMKLFYVRKNQSAEGRASDALSKEASDASGLESRVFMPDDSSSSDSENDSNGIDNNKNNKSKRKYVNNNYRDSSMGSGDTTECAGNKNGNRKSNHNNDENGNDKMGSIMQNARGKKISSSPKNEQNGSPNNNNNNENFSSPSSRKIQFTATTTQGQGKKSGKTTDRAGVATPMTGTAVESGDGKSTDLSGGARFSRNFENQLDNLVFVRRMRALRIPVHVGGWVAYEDCIFALTRFHLGCDELSDEARALLQKVRKFDDDEGELQLHHALSARSLLKAFRRKQQLRRENEELERENKEKNGMRGDSAPNLGIQQNNKNEDDGSSSPDRSPPPGLLSSLSQQQRNKTEKSKQSQAAQNNNNNNGKDEQSASPPHFVED